MEILLPVRDYDLAATLDSGQVFRWQPLQRFLDRRHRQALGPFDANARRHPRRNRRAGRRLALAPRFSANRNGFGRRAQNFSRRRADARCRRRVPRIARAAAGPVGMSRVVHFVLDQTNRPNPANRRPALRTIWRTPHPSGGHPLPRPAGRGTGRGARHIRTKIIYPIPFPPPNGSPRHRSRTARLQNGFSRAAPARRRAANRRRQI